MKTKRKIILAPAAKGANKGFEAIKEVLLRAFVDIFKKERTA